MKREIAMGIYDRLRTVLTKSDMEIKTAAEWWKLADIAPLLNAQDDSDKLRTEFLRRMVVESRVEKLADGRYRANSGRPAPRNA